MDSLFDVLADNVVAQVQPVCEQIKAMPVEQQIEALNQIRAALHEVSPFCDQPVDCVLWVPGEQVEGNDYNPNRVAPPEMRLLVRSIDADGMTQPVVSWRTNAHYEVVDGFHRTRVCRENEGIRKRLHGYVPVTVIRQSQEGTNDRVAATIRHNRARGKHSVAGMSSMVFKMLDNGWTELEVCNQLGMEPEEVLKLKHLTGFSRLFENEEYKRAWQTRRQIEVRRAWQDGTGPPD